MELGLDKGLQLRVAGTPGRDETQVDDSTLLISDHVGVEHILEEGA